MVVKVKLKIVCILGIIREANPSFSMRGNKVLTQYVNQFNTYIKSADLNDMGLHCVCCARSNLQPCFSASEPEDQHSYIGGLDIST